MSILEHKFGFNPLRDKKPVEQFGFVDVVKIMQSNSLPNVETDGANAYNGIDDPSSILGKPLDVFEAMHMQEAINDYKPESSGGKSDTSEG